MIKVFTLDHKFSATDIFGAKEKIEKKLESSNVTHANTTGEINTFLGRSLQSQIMEERGWKKQGLGKIR